MKYRTRPGTLLIHVCNEFLIVSSKEARQYCVPAIQLNETGAYIWNLIDSGMGKEDIVRSLMSVYEMDHIDPYCVLDQFLESLINSHFIMEDYKQDEAKENENQC